MTRNGIDQEIQSLQQQRPLTNGIILLYIIDRREFRTIFTYSLYITLKRGVQLFWTVPPSVADDTSSNPLYYNNIIFMQCDRFETVEGNKAIFN